MAQHPTANTPRTTSEFRGLKAMFFWLREIGGWGLIAVSLFLMRMGLAFVSDAQNPKIIEAAVILLTALGILRAGVLLIRISTAARLTRSEKQKT
jgi:hypothetical protein